MNRFFIAATVFLMALSSCQSSKVKITGRFVGTDVKTVYLEQVTNLKQELVDSVSLSEDGNFILTVEKAEASPSLYHIIYDNERIPLLLQGGDNITINAAGNALRNYTVEGSNESELLMQFNKPYVEGIIKVNDIISKYSAEELSDEERNKLAVEYTQLRQEIKRAQLRFIIEHKENIAAIYALYQRLPNDPNLFNGDSDVIYYRTVAEAVEQNYPESSYLPVLRSQIARMDAQISLLSQVKETNFPEIEMPDMYGNKIKLTSLEGKVILLHFWSAQAGNGNAANADLKEIYNKYHDLGFEIYQVGIDTSKAAWINVVQEQNLPWISVSDLHGQGSPVLGAYNVTKLPSSYLIDRTGNIVGKDLEGDALEKEIKKLI